MLGGGGYVAGPVGLAALARRIPLVLTEADSHLGVTNRAARAAARAASASRSRSRAATAAATSSPAGPSRRPSPTARAPGASSASATTSCACSCSAARSARARSTRPRSAAFADAPFRVLHVAGRRDFADLEAPGDHYLLRDYVTPFGRALAAADLSVARAGGSVFELAQYGLPAVLVPYPHASADHQTTNARWMADAGAAVVIPDAELTGTRLARCVAELVADPPAPGADGGGVAPPGPAGRRRATSPARCRASAKRPDPQGSARRPG